MASTSIHISPTELKEQTLCAVYLSIRIHCDLAPTRFTLTPPRKATSISRKLLDEPADFSYTFPHPFCQYAALCQPKRALATSIPVCPQSGRSDAPELCPSQTLTTSILPHPGQIGNTAQCQDTKLHRKGEKRVEREKRGREEGAESGRGGVWAKLEAASRTSG